MADYMTDIQTIIDKLVKQEWEYFYSMEHAPASNDRREIRLIFKRKAFDGLKVKAIFMDENINLKPEKSDMLYDIAKLLAQHETLASVDYDPADDTYTIESDGQTYIVSAKDYKKVTEYYFELKRKEQKEMPPLSEYQKGYNQGAIDMRNRMESLQKSIPLTPKRVIYSNPVTVVFWEDGTKTIVRCAKGEKFNKYYGFCAALAKKVFETNSRVNKIVDNGIDEKAKKAKKDIKKSSDKAKKKSSEGKKK